MHKYLIINADGFGFTHGVNRGIWAAAAAGTITSVSVTANFPAVEALPELVRAFPRLSVGVHLNPIAGRPLAAPHEVPSLVTPRGEFHYREFTTRLLQGHIQLDELQYELSLQIQRVAAMGIPISHLDSHQNRHLYPRCFFGVFLPLLRQTGIRCMRTHAHYLVVDPAHPRTAALRYYLARPSRLVTHVTAWFEMQCARRAGILMCDRLVAASTRGDKTQLSRWLEMLRAVPPGWSEVYCHPAYPDNDLRRWASYVEERREELAILTHPAFRKEITRSEITLASFHDLAASAAQACASGVDVCSPL